MRISRFLVVLVGVLFAALGIGFWMMPEPVGRSFQLEALGVAGLSALRADLGGLFVGLALFCLAGAWTKRRAFLLSATAILVAVLIGRLIGIFVNGFVIGVFPSLVLEVGAIAALAVFARAARAEEMAAQRSALVPVLVVVGALAVAGIGIAWAVSSPSVAQWLFDRGASRMTGRPNTALLEDDALRVAIVGSSAPLPSAKRAKAAVAVFAGGKFYLVDVGPESVENLLLWNVPMSAIGGVLLTHFHSDHIGDLGELNLQTWADGRPGPLPVYGGPGVDLVVDGFNLAYRLDQGYRTAHHSARVMPPETWPMIAHPVYLDGPATPEMSRSAQVLLDGQLRITAIEVNHPPIVPAYAYRFDYKGRSVVVTGDYKSHPPLAQAAKGADILVSEAIARPMVRALEKSAMSAGRNRLATIMHDVQDYHVSPEEAAEIANTAQVRLLVLYHLLPAPDDSFARRGFARGVGDVRRGDWVLAEDGSLYTLPVGSDQVRIGRLRG